MAVDNDIYYHGKPCKRAGHTLRYRRNSNCVECEKLRDRREYRESNKDAIAETLRKWYAKNETKVKAHSRNYYKANKAKIRAKKHRRRALVASASGSYTAKEWIALCRKYGNKCLACGSSEITVDHVVPLSKGGTNCIDNLQPLCSSCNSSKGTKSTDYRQQY